MARNIRWQAILALLGSLLLIALLGHLVAGRMTVLVPAVGGRYVEALVGYPQQINPLLAQYGTPERDLCALIFTGLTRAEADGEILPELAQAWQVSEDGLAYTFSCDRTFVGTTARLLLPTTSFLPSDSSSRPILPVHQSLPLRGRTSKRTRWTPTR